MLENNTLKCIILSIFFISCNKELSDNTTFKNDYDNYKSSIYHSEYSNVVKINGKYVVYDLLSSYVLLGGRKEGIYSSNYDIFSAIENHSLKRVSEIIDNDNSIKNKRIEHRELLYNDFTFYDYSINNTIPIMIAIFYRDLGIFKYLLDKNSDLYITDDNGRNSFLWACTVGNVYIIKELINKDSSLISSIDHNGANGLLLAVQNNNIDVIEYLVNDLSIDINSTDFEGNDVFYYSSRDDIMDLLRMLGAK